MAIIIATSILVIVTVGLLAPLAIPSVRHGKYGYFMFAACWLPFILVVLSIALVFCVFKFQIPKLRWEQKEAAFAEYIDEYLSISPYENVIRKFAVGRMIVVDKTEKKIATNVCFRLPSKLRASTPADVETIVWLEWHWQQEGFYTDGKVAKRIDCEVRVIDKASQTLLFSTRITGDPPPKGRTRWESPSGGRPTNKIVKYLKSLSSIPGVAPSSQKL